jgi:hypothetical protein
VPPPLGLSPAHRYETSPLQPTAASALHHPPEAIQPLPAPPPPPSIPRTRGSSIAITAGENRAPPRRREPFSDLSLSNLSWGKASPHLPGACAHRVYSCSPAPRWERRCPDAAAADSSPAVLRYHSSSTSPSVMFSSPCRLRCTDPFPPRASPPARTPEIGAPDAIACRQGHICKNSCVFKGLSAKTQGPQCKTLLLFYVIDVAVL